MTAEQQLPEGWKETTLGAEFEWSSGGTPKSGVPAYYENGSIHWLNISDLNDGLISYAEKKITELGLQESSAKIVPQGSVLIAIYGSIGKLGINTIPLATNQAICFTKKIPEYILNKFLFYYLLSIRNQLISMGKGGTQQNISQTVLKSVPFFYPTSKETQQAIVNKIESLFDEIDEGIGRLKTAARQIQQYRQSLLKNAFNGELTKEWRSKHADTLPSENELLAQIQTTREQHHAQQLADWQTAVSQWEQNGKEGKKPSKPILKKITTNISDNEINVPDKHWFVGLFGDLVDIKSNLVKPDEYLDFPHIAPDNIEKNTGKLLSFKTIREDEVISPKHYFYAGQIIYSKIRPNLSKLVLVDFNGLCSADMYPLESDVFNHSFLKYIMLSRYFVKKASTAGSRSVLPKINQSELDMIPLPICSPAEQTQIVTILESKLTACDQLADELAKQLKQAELLKQAVLKAAFQGELSE